MCYPLRGATEQLSQGLNPGLPCSTMGTFHSPVPPHWSSGGSLFLGLGWRGAHLARVTRGRQEFLLLPCSGRQVTPNLLMKRQWVPRGALKLYRSWSLSVPLANTLPASWANLHVP